jgi:hypothetical protein
LFEAFLAVESEGAVVRRGWRAMMVVELRMVAHGGGVPSPRVGWRISVGDDGDAKD